MAERAFPSGVFGPPPRGGFLRSRFSAIFDITFFRKPAQANARDIYFQFQCNDRRPNFRTPFFPQPIESKTDKKFKTVVTGFPGGGHNAIHKIFCDCFQQQAANLSGFYKPGC